MRNIFLMFILLSSLQSFAAQVCIVRVGTAVENGSVSCSNGRKGPVVPALELANLLKEGYVILSTTSVADYGVIYTLQKP
jgi:hypothetical protein